MQTLAQNKGIIISTVLFGTALIVYNLFSAGELSLPAAALSSSGVDNQLVNLATELSQINFDKKLFTTTGYRILTDFSTVLPQEPTGRPNPFDIIGRD